MTEEQREEICNLAYNKNIHYDNSFYILAELQVHFANLHGIFIWVDTIDEDQYKFSIRSKGKTTDYSIYEYYEDGMYDTLMSILENL
jgi:hypothetical protein